MNRTVGRATVVVAITAALFTPGSTATAQEARAYVNASSATNPNATPFSGAVRIGNTLYISGTLGLEAGQRVPATPEAEARNVLNNIRAIVEQADMTMDDLVLVQVHCSDVAFYDAFNSVYRTFFTQEFPARAFLGAGTLLFGARFEVLGIAVER